MRHNDLYILTHSEFAPVIQQRHEALIASMQIDPRPSEARIAMVQSLLATSIYGSEAARERCSGFTNS